MIILTKIVSIKYNWMFISPHFLSNLQQHGGGHLGLWYYSGIELFFKRYFGNLDLKVRYHLALRYAVFHRLKVFGKRRPFTADAVLFIALSCHVNARQYF